MMNTYILNPHAIHLQLIVGRGLAILDHLEGHGIEVEPLLVSLKVSTVSIGPIGLRLESPLELAIVVAGTWLEKATAVVR